MITLYKTYIFYLLLSLLAILASAIAYNDNGNCFSFGGGNVFPEWNKRVDHQLQVTKAVSEYFFYVYTTFLYRQITISSKALTNTVLYIYPFYFSIQSCSRMGSYCSHQWRVYTVIDGEF